MDSRMSPVRLSKLNVKLTDLTVILHITVVAEVTIAIESLTG